MANKNAKSEALKKHLGNVVCSKCDSKKHSTKEHNSKAKDHYEDGEDRKGENKKEINGDDE